MVPEGEQQSREGDVVGIVGGRVVPFPCGFKLNLAFSEHEWESNALKPESIELKRHEKNETRLMRVLRNTKTIQKEYDIVGLKVDSYCSSMT